MTHSAQGRILGFHSSVILGKFTEASNSLEMVIWMCFIFLIYSRIWFSFGAKGWCKSRCINFTIHKYKDESLSLFLSPENPISLTTPSNNQKLLTTTSSTLPLYPLSLKVIPQRVVLLSLLYLALPISPLKFHPWTALASHVWYLTSYP